MNCYIIRWKNKLTGAEGTGAFKHSKEDAERICGLMNTVGDGRTYWIELAEEEPEPVK